MKNGKLEAHPYADLLPMMNKLELDALTDDIRQNGLLHPIMRYQGMVLDGRNRLAACQAAGVEPRFVDIETDDATALAHVISANIERRDLNGSQRAIVAARRWGLDGYSKGGRPGKAKPSLTGTVSVEALARQFKVGKDSIAHARDLLREDPGCAAEVAAGRMSLADAYSELELSRKEAAQKEADTARAARYLAAVKDGEMSFEEALRRALEDERAEEERAKIGERWHGLMHDLHREMSGVANAGGIEALAAVWDGESRGLIRAELDGMIENLAAWRDHLRGLADGRDRDR